MESLGAFPPPPSASIDWEKIGVEISAVNGHIESRWNAKTGQWSKPKLVASPILEIHGLSPALNYGQQAYEGLKAFRGPNGDIHAFRVADHARRFASSCKYVSIPSPPGEHFGACVRAAVAANSEFVPPHATGASLYLRPLIFGLGGQHMALAPPDDYLFCVFANPINAYLGGVGPMKALVLDEFDRAAPRGTGSAKIGGNYAPVMPWSERARADGFALTLHLDSADRAAIDEFSSSGFVGIKTTTARSSTGGKAGQDGDLAFCLVIPDSNSIVASITGDCCVKLATRRGWHVERRKIVYTELPTFSEVLAVGTAVGISAVGSITRKSTDDHFIFAQDGKPGPRCLELLRELRDVQSGRSSDDFGWRDSVTQDDLCVG